MKICATLICISLLFFNFMTIVCAQGSEEEPTPAPIEEASSSVSQLVDLLRDPDKKTRLDAVEKLEQMGNEAKEAMWPLIKTLRSDKEGEVRVAIVRALAQISDIGDKIGVVVLSEALSDSAKEVRNAAQAALFKIAPEVARGKEIEKKTGGIIHFALSIGYRYAFKAVKDITISPIDSTLKVDSKDHGALTLSGVVLATPFKDTKWCKWLGFVANVNLAEFTESSISLNNKEIEGGLGIAVLLSDNFSLGLTYERVFNRSPRNYVVELAKKNEKISIDGQPLKDLNKEDDSFFEDDSLNAWSVKFIYRFGK